MSEQRLRLCRETRSKAFRAAVGEFPRTVRTERFVDGEGSLDVMVIVEGHFNDAPAEYTGLAGELGIALSETEKIYRGSAGEPNSHRITIMTFAVG